MAITTRRMMEEEEEQNHKKTKTKQQIQQQEVDRISELPDDILHPIMSLLSLKEACITSSLSKRWRSLFSTLPSILFRFNDSSTTHFGIEWRLEAARHILGSRRAPVRICTVRSYCFAEYGDEIGDIIRFICNDGIQELSIYDADKHCARYTVPSSLYFCSTLTRIELSRCILKVPAKFSLLRRLNTLKIQGCIVEDSDLQRLISGCRAVERLTLEHCHRLRSLVVDAPKLSMLDVTTHRPLVVSIVNAPLLESVTVRFRDHPKKYYLDKCPSAGEDDTDNEYNDEVSRLLGLLQSLGSIQNLSLEFQSRYMKLSRTEGLAVPATLGSLLPKMKKLTLKMQLNSTYTVSTVSCLLNTCPHLEDLVIVLDRDGKSYQCPDDSVLRFWDRKIPSDCTRNTLRVVTFSLEKGGCWSLGINLVKFLLRNARVLKKLVIDCCYQMEGLSMLKDLHTEMFLLRTASPYAVIELKTARCRMLYTPSQLTSIATSSF